MFFDIRKEKKEVRGLEIEEGDVNTISYSTSLVGVRCVGKGVGFVVSNEFRPEMLEKAKRLSMGRGVRVKKWKKVKFRRSLRFEEQPLELVDEIYELLNDEVIKHRIVGIYERKIHVEYENSEGSEASYDVKRTSVKVIIRSKGLEMNFLVKGFLDRNVRMKDIERDVNRLVEELKLMVKARHAPAGRMPVILDPELAGVFFHEAVGHACEGDAILEGTSVLGGKLGKEVASEVVTLYDDPTQKGFGYFPLDDEGIEARRRTLIEKGVLKDYLHSRESAAKLKGAPGNGRAESAAHLPLPRMSNTILEKGDSNLQEMLEEMKDGIYMKGSIGGVVEPSHGFFLFSAKYGFLVRDGEITEPVKGVSLSGNILKTLKDIVLIGKKRYWVGSGYCGKLEQTVPVDQRMPFILLEEAVVGGRI
ncbi:MAG: TldD/PmbA family protein [Nanoarchaeota archaeon]|nr:TldD/PmbA family protein [Nanoarchaeota archaeon]